MTALVGTSVLLIAASAIALVTGWVTADESLIWTSIGASAAAAVALALAYFRARQGDTGTVPMPAADADAAAPEPTASGPSAPEETTAEPAAAEPVPRKRPERRAPAPRPARAAAKPKEMSVAGVPGRKRFHRTDCRYASAKTAQTMTRAEAVDEGYEPCAICKP